jgi:hypothetical protein
MKSLRQFLSGMGSAFRIFPAPSTPIQSYNSMPPDESFFIKAVFKQGQQIEPIPYDPDEVRRSTAKANSKQGKANSAGQ